MARNNSQSSAARRWHRFFGAGTAVFVVFMVLSGLSLNHSHSMGLDQRHVSHPFVLGWYGLGEPENVHSFAVGSDWLSFAGSQLYLNGSTVASVSNGVGAVSNGGMLIAAGSEELLLLDRAGSLIERQPWGPTVQLQAMPCSRCPRHGRDEGAGALRRRPRTSPFLPSARSDLPE